MMINKFTPCIDFHYWLKCLNATSSLPTKVIKFWKTMIVTIMNKYVETNLENDVGRTDRHSNFVEYLCIKLK